MRPRDIIMSMANSRELVGKVALVDNAPPSEAAIGGFIAILRTRNLEPRYLMSVLRSDYARTALIDSSSQTTNIANISLAKLRPLPVPLPPLAEQRRIVARVEALMGLCDELEAHGRLQDEQHARLVATLFDALVASASPKELADNWRRIASHFDLLLDRPAAVDALEQTILQLAVRVLLVPQDATDEPVDNLLTKIRDARQRVAQATKIRAKVVSCTPPDAETLFDLPLGWRWVRLVELARFIDYRGRTPHKTPSGIPLITAKNVRQGYIDREPREFIAGQAYTGWMTRGIPQLGDVLFTTEAPLGNVAAVDIEGQFALAQRVICFALYEPGMSRALQMLLMSPWFQSQLIDNASGVTARGIKSARLQLMLVPVPPLAEQHRIVARVDELRALCTGLRQHLQRAQATQSHLADALVARAIS